MAKCALFVCNDFCFFQGGWGGWATFGLPGAQPGGRTPLCVKGNERWLARMRKKEQPQTIKKPSLEPILFGGRILLQRDIPPNPSLGQQELQGYGRRARFVSSLAHCWGVLTLVSPYRQYSTLSPNTFGIPWLRWHLNTHQPLKGDSL